MNGDDAVMYTHFGELDEVNGLGIAGCSNGRRDTVALSGKWASFCLFSFALLCAELFRDKIGAAGALSEITEAAPDRSDTSTDDTLGDCCGCAQVGVRCDGSDDVLGSEGLRSPAAVRFFPAGGMLEEDMVC